MDNGHIGGLKGEGDTGVDGGYAVDGGEGEGGDAAEREEVYSLSGLEETGLKLGDIPARQRERNSDADDESSVDSLFDVPDGRGQENGGTGLDTSRATATSTTTTNRADPFSERTTLSRLIDQDEAEDGDAVGNSTWRIPNTSTTFSTPNWNKSRSQPISSNAVRSTSPPDTGSLWALPRRRGRPSTGGTRKYRKKSDSRPESNNTPVIAHDWASAQTPDVPPAGSPWTLPRRWDRAGKDYLGESKKGSDSIPNHQFKSRSSPVMYDSETDESDDPLQEELPSPTPTPVFNIRGRGLKSPAQRQVPSSPSRLRHATLSSSGDSEHDTEDEEELSDSDGSTSDSQSIQMPTEVQPNTPDPKSNKSSTLSPNSTPKSRHKRTFMTPNDAKLIIKLRHVEQRGWKEILNYFPDRSKDHLSRWNQTHWNQRLRNPPQMSRPWSVDELLKLDRFKDMHDLTWSGIRDEIPGRGHAEVEFELLRLWAGDDVW